MAGTTADKLALLADTKAELKAALAEKGQTVGEVFSDYPAAVRAIQTGGGAAEEVTLLLSNMGGTVFTGTRLFVQNGSGASILTYTQIDASFDTEIPAVVGGICILYGVSNGKLMGSCLTEQTAGDDPYGELSGVYKIEKSDSYAISFVNGPSPDA